MQIAIMPSFIYLLVAIHVLVYYLIYQIFILIL